MSLLKACADCGALTDRPRCLDCKPRVSAHSQGYTSTWARLSKRARRLQPWCLDCGTTEDLTTDHSTEAWERHEAGREITLDLVEVVCRSCNSKRGRARPHRGDPPSQEGQSPEKAFFPSQLGTVLNKGVE